MTTKEEYIKHLIELAKDNLCSGIIEEPRGFFDTFAITADGNIVRSHPDVFRNGEQFPVRLTHMVLAARALDTDDAEQNDFVLQNVGMRLIYHDQYYMSPVYTPLPLFQNTVNAGSPIVIQSTASWRFPRPFVLSARDTIKVTTRLEQAVVDDSKRVSVTFTGVGLLSRRPYFVSGSTTLASAINQVVIPTDNFRTDGAEPVLITDMTLNLSGALTAEDPTGDVRYLVVQVRQVGNGTNADWFTGPIGLTTNGAPFDLCPATLLGISSGRALVHELPGEGLIWEPGEGLDAEMLQLSDVDAAGAQIALGFFGYIAVQ